MSIWQSKEQLTELLCSLVNYPSITGSEAEIAFASHLYSLLKEKQYFKKHPEHIKLHPLEDGRQLVTALVKQGDTNETVVLLSHFDVVDIEDYGSLKDFAFKPKELTEKLLKQEQLPDLVKQDIKTGEWLFGRGTMDMKAGIAVQLSMLERAMEGQFNGNILFVSVPDEEVNSLGVQSALPVMDKLKQEERLEFVACINGEPMFSKYPGDKNNYFYTGSIGKVLPGFLCYGKETHVGEPFAGLNANLMSSYLSQELELNESFIEAVGEEITPPPVSLMQRDLKEHYSVQTPTTAVSMYNVLYLKQSIEEINEKLFRAAEKASISITKHFNEKVHYYSNYNSDFVKPNMNVNVFMYEELYQIAVKKFGEEEVKCRQNLLISQREVDDRDFSTILVQDLASLCKELAPMIILFYCPPFYPSVSSYEDSVIKRAATHVQDYAQDKFELNIKEVEYFPGLSDLSYLGPVSSGGNNLHSLVNNMPIQGNGFSLPEEAMEAITMPIINIGPLGKDPHQWTERLELNYSFNYLPKMLSEAIQTFFEK